MSRTERTRSTEWVDLAPSIPRQRLLIEGVCARPIRPEQITDYLAKLAGVCDMVPLMEPLTHHSERFGWAGWVHWETSGAHFYAWDEPEPFFSVDIYTCKRFDAAAVVRFTGDYFDARHLVFKEP